MRILYTILFIILLSSCDKILLDEEPSNNPVSCFDNLWNTLNDKYGGFLIKNINWDSVYLVYRPLVNENSTDSQLYTVITQMLDVLNDNHVSLCTTDNRFPLYRSGIYGQIDTINDFDLNIIKGKYLKTARTGGPYTYGMLDDSIGYIYINNFADLPDVIKDDLNDAFEYLKKTKGMVVDDRSGDGGEDMTGKFIAGYFATQSIYYMKSRVKSGAGKYDFTSFEKWYVEPEGKYQYTNPVIVLTNRTTISARETFCLAMTVLPQVIFVGDTTSGAFSNCVYSELPNGWLYSYSIGEWYDANDISYEGKGYPPDIVIQNKKDDILNGKDGILEKAITLLH